MGIENRDYYRQRSGGSNSSIGPIGITPVVKWLIILNVTVFLLQIFITRPGTIADYEGLLPEREEPLTAEELDELTAFLPRISIVQQWFQLETDKVIRQAQVWRLITHAFCHDRMAVFHILFNMLFLFWFGKTLEAMYGSREFLLFYILGALAAAFAYIALDLATGLRVPAIGASGAVMAVLMLYTCHFPRDRLYIYFLFPIEIWVIVLLYVIFDVHPVLLTLAGAEMSDGVAHAAHLGGLAFGFIYWKTGMRLAPGFDSLQSKIKRNVGPRRNLKVFRPSNRAQLDAQVDQILEKISQHGKQSLTDEELDLLENASRKYKDGDE